MGQGEKWEKKDGFCWMELAKTGDGEALYCMGQCCFNVKPFIRDDDVAAADYFRRSAETGYGLGMYMLAYCYQNGMGVTKDMDAANQWYAKAVPALRYAASEHGDAESMCYLGHCYHFGTGVEENKVQAATWYRKAASLGHGCAMQNLAGYYLDGVGGCLKSLPDAIVWFQRAASLGVDYSRAKLRSLETVVNQLAPQIAAAEARINEDLIAAERLGKHLGER